MPPKDKHEQAKRIWYFIDEALVFLVMFLAVLMKETIVAMTKGDPVTNLIIKGPKILASVLIAIIVYGSMNESFKYNDKNKPPLFKRLAQAILHGLGWQSLSDLPGV